MQIEAQENKDNKNVTEPPSDVSPVVELKGHTGKIYATAFSPDGKKIVTGSQDKTARTWDAESGRELQKLEGHTESVHSVIFSPDGTKIVTEVVYVDALVYNEPGYYPNSTTHIWDAKSRQELLKLKDYKFQSNPFSPDGKKIAAISRDNTVCIWDAESGKELHVLKVPKLKGQTNFVHSAAFSPDCTMIVTGSADKTARIWDTESGKELLKLRGHTGNLFCAAFFPDGRKIITSSQDNTARIWDVESGKELLKLSLCCMKCGFKIAESVSKCWKNQYFWRKKGLNYLTVKKESRQKLYHFATDVLKCCRPAKRRQHC